MKTCSVFVLLLLMGGKSFAYDSTLWANVLSTFVQEDGMVDYKHLKLEPQQLDGFVAQLKTTGPTFKPALFPTRADRFAFWLNAYNALVLYGVKEAYPVTSVTEIEPNFGFFKKKAFQVDGQRLTLDQIEHEILRPVFQDPRIHAAINCAAKSCPKLNLIPFQASQLEHQLQSAMHNMIHSPKHVRLDLDQKTLYLSQIFSWFQSDFTNWLRQNQPNMSASLIEYIGLFVTEKQNKLLRGNDLKIVFQEYDWSLNDQTQLHDVEKE